MAAAALWLHATRQPSETEIGWNMVSLLRSGDPAALAAAFPEQELREMGLDRKGAERVVKEVVLPRLGTMADNIVAVTLGGTPGSPYVVLEKPKGNPRYYNPPMIPLADPDAERPRLSLTLLLWGMWANERENAALGLRDPNWEADRLADKKKLVALGTKAFMDWERRQGTPLVAQR